MEAARFGGAWLTGREALAAAAAAAGGGRGAARGRVKRGGRGGAPDDAEMVNERVGMGGMSARLGAPVIAMGPLMLIVLLRAAERECGMYDMWRLDEIDEFESDEVDTESTDDAAESSEVPESLDTVRRCLTCVRRRRMDESGIVSCCGNSL